MDGRVPTGLVVTVWVIIDLAFVRVFADLPEALFGDAHIYLRAASAWLEGGDPWAAGYLGYEYAGPPLTLLPYAPLTLLPEDVAVWVVAVACGLAVVAGIRALGFPLYWVLFPPLVEAVLEANPDAFLVLLLALSPRLAAAGAPVLKIYATVPLAARRQWRPLVGAAAILLATIPILPWADFIAQYGSITAVLQEQSWKGISAWGNVPLMLAVAVALLSLGLVRAGSLAVPALWPHTQLHYAAVAVSEARPLVLALALSLPFPFAVPVGVITYAGVTRLRARIPALEILVRPV